MKAFLDYITEVTNTEPFEFYYNRNYKAVTILHKKIRIATLFSNYGIAPPYEFKLLGSYCSIFTNTIFHAPLMKWRFL